MHLIRCISWKRFQINFTFVNFSKNFLAHMLSITGTITTSNLSILLVRGNDRRKETLNKYMFFAAHLPETNKPMPLLSPSRGSAQ